MEHFPPILDPIDPIRVPYLGGSYDSEETFATYPARKGFDLQQVQLGVFGDQARESVAQMLQAWLYFGLMSEVLQIPINEQDFVSSSSDASRYVTTAKLREYLQHWRKDHEQAKDKDPSLLEERKSRVIRALRTSHAAWRGFKDFRGIVGAEVELSIQLLGSALEHAVTSVSPNKGLRTMETWIHVNEAPWRRTPSPYVESRMREIGWCPSIIRQLGRPTQLGFLTYISLLRPSAPFSNHNNCDFNDFGCSEKNIEPKTYTTKHVTNCVCLDKTSKAFLSVDKAELQRIVEKGEVPICYFEDGGNELEPKLKVMSRRHDRQYTAVSHVWSDGLGNPEDNSLPLCQIRRIVGYISNALWSEVSKVEPATYNDSIWYTDPPPAEPIFTAEELMAAPKYFWIDTLCVPRSPMKLRKAAIKTMSSIYKRANRVLVLDSSLYDQAGTLDTLSGSEIHARISASTWVRRYWTYQEGVQAKLLIFQFRDTAFRLLDPNDATQSIYEHFFDDEVSYYVESTDFRINDRDMAKTYVGRVQAVWSALAGRVSSYEEDRPLIIAMLLDMDIRDMLNATAADRMKMLWSMYKEFPLGVLCRPAARLDDPRQPWAYADLLDCNSVSLPMSVPAVQKDGGLEFAHHAFVLIEPLRRWPKGLIAVNYEGKTYFIRQNTKNSNKSWEGIDFLAPRTGFAVLLGQDVVGEISGCLGALVSIRLDSLENQSASLQQGQGGLLKGRYLRAVSVMMKDSIFDEMANPPWSSDDNEEKLDLYEVTQTPPDQLWHLSP